MLVAFSTEGENLDSLLDTRFGRCRNFLVLDATSSDFKVMENAQNLHAAQGAGIQSAQNVIAAGAQALVTGHCGPKAFKVLQAAGVSIYLGEEKSIRALIEDFHNGKLEPLTSPNVEGHW